MNRAVQKIAADKLSGVPEITEGLLNNIEVGIRAYDPCLSCATHALGQMPLEVTIFDAGGRILDQRLRSSR
jgi:NAD-reducing hydrogenase large subunit